MVPRQRFIIVGDVVAVVEEDFRQTLRPPSTRVVRGTLCRPLANAASS